MNILLNDLKSRLSAEWRKPKKANLKEFDKREPRNYKRIRSLQVQITNLKQ